MTGGQSELPLVQAIAGRLSAPHIVLAGETSLGQLAAVFARCRLVLGADSGPLHLAVAVGAPTVHLFGPVDPALFGAWGEPHRHVVLQARFFDLPCHNRPCNRLDYTAAELPQHPCMQTIYGAGCAGRGGDDPAPGVGVAASGNSNAPDQRSGALLFPISVLLVNPYRVCPTTAQLYSVRASPSLNMMQPLVAGRPSTDVESTVPLASRAMAWKPFSEPPA